MNNSNKTFKQSASKTGSKPAYSLVFAFLMMTVIMIIAATTIENTQDKVRYFNELEGSTQARLAAESAAELAIMEVRAYEAGYDPDDDETAFCMDNNSNGDCEDLGESYGGYEVYSTATLNDSGDGSGYYYLPIPGTGTAGNSSDCSILNSDMSIDHPCNWNKWMYGETVTLPLYGVDSSGSFVSPYDAGLTDWVLKVRTPCTDGTYSSGCTRYDFGANAADIETDPSLILWQVTGEDDDGTIALYPSDAALDYHGATTRISTNTEIPASFIDSGVDSEAYDILTLDLNSLPSDFESTDLEYYILNDTNITDLSMQLDLISSLVTGDGDSIPYLEWQVYSYAISEQLISPITAIKGEGFYKGSKGTYYFPYIITRSSTGGSSSIYTLSN